MPLYIADYKADTEHLSGEEHGYYLLMLMTYWQTEKPLLNNDVELARICKTSLRRFRQLKLRVLDLFHLDGNLLVHKRVEAELAEYHKKLDLKRLAGQKSGEKRREISQKNQLKKMNTCSTPVEHTLNRCSHTESYIPNAAKTNIKYIYNNNINNNSVVNLNTKANKVSTRPSRNSEYLRELESWFPNMALTNSRIFAMLKRWNEADVERIDIQTALECKKAEKHAITSPLYFEFVVVDFAESRRKGHRKPAQYETLDEKNERGIREAIARIEKRERGEIT